MSYVLVTAPNALDRLVDLPAHACDVVERELTRLATSPETLSRRPPTPPFKSVGRIFEFECFADEGLTYHFTAFFTFGPSDDKITVFDVTVQIIRVRR